MPGSKLFFRIFLWFLAALFVLFALGIATAYLTHEGFSRSSALSDMQDAFSAVETRAVDILTTSGRQNVNRYLEGESRERRIALMLTPLGKGMERDKPAPPGFPLSRIRRLAMETPPGTTEFIFSRPLFLLVKRIDIGGEPWALVGVRVMRPLFHARHDNPWRGALQLLVIII
ncbi:MAG: hypothetical protein U9R40_01455, partial [Synergistota bacterium]|nr:hypothetical protein [Synergistota bacterium]